MSKNNGRRTLPWRQVGHRRWEPLDEARQLQERLDREAATNEQFQEIHDAGIDVVMQDGPRSIRPDPLDTNPSHYFEQNARRRARSANQEAQDQPAAHRRYPPHHGASLHQPTLTQLAIDGNILPLNHPNQEGRRRRQEALAEAARQRRHSPADEDRNRPLGTNQQAQADSLAERFRRNRPHQIEREVAQALTLRHLNDVTGSRPDYTPPTPNYSPDPATYRTPSSQATNPQGRRAGPGQPTPTPTPVTPQMNNDMDDIEGGGGNVEQVAQNGVNQGRPGALQQGGATKYNYLPRNINEKEITLNIQRMVRFDLISRAETFGSLVTDTYGALWNGAPGTVRTSEWRFIPNQTWECYLTPVLSRQILDLAGWGGEIKMEHCGVHVFNTRLAMQLPQETGFLITVDKPYFKVYEDKPRELFGHGFLGAGAADIAPSANEITNGNVHHNVQNLTPTDLPAYLHSLQGAIAQTAQTVTDTQLNLESSGGIEFYQPGDEFAKSWKISGEYTPVQVLQGTALYGQLDFTDAAAGATIRGYIGYNLPVHSITRYSTSPVYAVEERSKAHGNCPNMVLMTIPDINSINIGGGDFTIQSELQMNVTYTAAVTIKRYDDPNWTVSVTTTGGNGAQYLTAAAAYLHPRRKRGDGVYGSTRPEQGAWLV